MSSLLRHLTLHSDSYNSNLTRALADGRYHRYGDDVEVIILYILTFITKYKIHGIVIGESAWNSDFHHWRWLF